MDETFALSIGSGGGAANAPAYAKLADMEQGDWLLLLAIFVAAIVYSAVGHGGASGYLAAMALFGVAPAAMKPAALVLNIAVAALGGVRWLRAGHFDWRLFWPFALGSIPFAYVGGGYTLSDATYRYLVAAALMLAGLRLIVPIAPGALRPPPLLLLQIGLGAALGLISGLTGVGGGIFLSPLLLLFRWADVRTSAGVAAAFILVNSIAALIGHGLHTATVWPSALPLWTGVALLGALIGTDLGITRMAPQRLRQLLGVILWVAAWKLWLLAR